MPTRAAAPATTRNCRTSGRRSSPEPCWSAASTPIASAHRRSARTPSTATRCCTLRIGGWKSSSVRADEPDRSGRVFLKLRGAERAAGRLYRNRRHAIGAVLLGRRRRRFLRPVELAPQTIDLPDQYKHRECDDQKPDHRVYENTVVDGGCPGFPCGSQRGILGSREIDVVLGKIDAAHEVAYGRHEDVVDERIDDRGESRAYDDSDGQIDDVAAGNELLELG